MLEDNNNIYEVHENTIIKLNLLSENVNLDDEKAAIIFWNEYYKIYTKILNVYAKKMLCETEVRELIVKENTQENVVEMLIDELKANAIINDDLYKKMYLGSYEDNLKFSSNKIKFELESRKINLTDLEFQDLQAKDLEKCQKIVEKYQKKMLVKSHKEFQQFIYNKLLGYRYDNATISEVLSSVSHDELSSLRRIYRKYSQVYSQDKVIKKLINKGFSYEHIKEVVNE